MESKGGVDEAEGADAGGAEAGSSSGLSENIEIAFEFGNVPLEPVTAVGANCVEEDRGDESDEGCVADALAARHNTIIL